MSLLQKKEISFLDVSFEAKLARLNNKSEFLHIFNYIGLVRRSCTQIKLNV